MNSTREARKRARLIDLAESLSEEQRNALLHAMLCGGRNWKAMLRDAWMHDRYAAYDDLNAPILQRLRNLPYFGPQGLVDYPADAILPHTEGGR